MKGSNVYRVAVSLWGPIQAKYSKNGRGVYVVSETTENKAKKCVEQYMHDNNLFGSIQGVSKQAEPRFVPARGEVMTSSDYSKKVEELDVPAYQFTPKISEKGLKQHKYVRQGVDYRERNVKGAFGKVSEDKVESTADELVQDISDSVVNKVIEPETE